MVASSGKATCDIQWDLFCVFPTGWRQRRRSAGCLELSLVFNCEPRLFAAGLGGLAIEGLVGDHSFEHVEGRHRPELRHHCSTDWLGLTSTSPITSKTATPL